MPVNIRINNDYRITSDQYQFVLNERYISDPTKAPGWKKREAEGADPTPREKWREVGYYGTIESASKAVINRSIRESEAQSLAEVVDLIYEVKRNIDESLAIE